MSDLIDREQAKDAIDKYLVGRNLVTDGTFMARLINEIVIDRLQSALGTNLAEVGTDAISRQQAIDAADVYMKRLCRYIGTSDDTRAYAFARGLLVGIKTDLGELPSAQPKMGKWIEDKGQQTLMKNFIERGEVWRVCSVCGAGHMIGHRYAIDKAYHDRHHNFCPNCGAKMEVTE